MKMKWYHWIIISIVIGLAIVYVGNKAVEMYGAFHAIDKAYEAIEMLDEIEDKQ